MISKLCEIIFSIMKKPTTALQSRRNNTFPPTTKSEYLLAMDILWLTITVFMRVKLHPSSWRSLISLMITILKKSNLLLKKRSKIPILAYRCSLLFYHNLYGFIFILKISVICAKNLAANRMCTSFGLSSPFFYIFNISTILFYRLPRIMKE